MLDIYKNICYSIDNKTTVYNFFSFSVVVVVVVVKIKIVYRLFLWELDKSDSYFLYSDDDVLIHKNLIFKNKEKLRHRMKTGSRKF